MRLRGVQLVGTLDDLDPVESSSPESRFALSDGRLTGAALEWRIPMRLDSGSGAVQTGGLYVCLDYSRSEGRIAMVLRVAGVEYRSRWLQNRFDEAIGDLREQLPRGLRPRMCHACGLAEYSNLGYGTFGELACFRDTPEAIRQVNASQGSAFKTGLFRLWPEVTEFVEETHLCPDYEPGGSRSTPSRAHPNLWTPDWWDPDGLS